MNAPALYLALVSVVICVWNSPAQASERQIDLRPLWDEVTPLANPHKGWYHHFPDNHINKYVIRADSDLVDFPGMDHLYIRLAWAYLEPEEGKFNWPIIDDLISKWTAKGLGIAFRISCKETSTDRIEQQFATPKWVMEAGAQGGHYRMGKPTGPDGPWEPLFNDPIFLEKLDQFLKAFAARYDGEPWLRYIDIGSIGDWGEGHCWAGSRRPYNFEQRKVHVDMHLKHFPKSQLVISDDFIHETGGPDERRRMHEYVMQNGISYRDDSILVDGYFAGHSATATVRSPEFFSDIWQRLPTVLELEHYSAVKNKGNWLATPGSSIAKHAPGKTGADMLRDALDRLHATYIGYHGYAHEWLADNPRLTGELLNRCGYWYFPHQINLPEKIKAGEAFSMAITWENRGVAPAYQPFRLLLRLEGSERVALDIDAKNRNWLPRSGQTLYTERYELKIPPAIKPGASRLRAKLFCPQTGRDVAIGLRSDARDSEGYYLLSELWVE